MLHFPNKHSEATSIFVSKSEVLTLAVNESRCVAFIFFTPYMSSSCLFPGSPLCFLMKAATVQEITSEAREEFPLVVCVHLGVAVLLLVSANWSECTKNSLFLGNLSTLEWEDECASDTCLSLATSYTRACMGYACARERAPSLTSLNLTVLIR